MAGRIAEALRLVRLEHLGERLPRQLSGGQQQRVALARALVFRPDVLLLDEPLSNLDAKLRQEVRVEIREMQKKLGLTTVMVTHDQEEALTMADRLVVMSDGAVRQVGTQQDLYERPTDRFVAGFVGRSTFIEGQIEAPGRFRSAGGLALACDAATAGPATLALRPERIVVDTSHQRHGQLRARRGGIRFLSGRDDRHARAHLTQGARGGAGPEPCWWPRAGGRRRGARRLAGRQRHRVCRRRDLITERGDQQDCSPEAVMTKIAMKSTSRRQVLMGTAAIAATGLAGCPTRAAAQAKGKIVVGTWGGDYARLLNKNIEQPILIKDGWEVIQDQAGDPERRSKILAERRLPRGTTDVQGLSALNMFQMHDAGVVDAIEYGKLKNAPTCSTR